MTTVMPDNENFFSIPCNWQSIMPSSIKFNAAAIYFFMLHKQRIDEINAREVEVSNSYIRNQFRFNDVAINTAWQHLIDAGLIVKIHERTNNRGAIWAVAEWDAYVARRSSDAEIIAWREAIAEQHVARVAQRREQLAREREQQRRETDAPF